jgi:hypothetical protein
MPRYRWNNMRVVVGLLVVAGLLPCAAAAQAPDSTEPSVTLTLSPTEIPVHGTVAISGLGYPQKGAPVNVTIKAPNGTATTLTAAPDKNGRYSASFSQTPVNGDYTVSAQIGAKSIPATGTFTVRTYLMDIDDDVADNKAFLEEGAAYVAAVKTGIDNLPDSPARTEMETKLGDLNDATKQFPEQAAHLAAALGHYKTLVSENPDAAAVLQPFFDHLAQLDAQEKEETKEFAKEIQESEKNLQACDAIDHATTGLKAVPEIIAAVKKPFEFVLNFTINMAKSEAPPEAANDATAVGKLVKGLPKAASKPTESLAENEIEIGSESEIAEQIVSHIPASVRETPAYKFVVKETKSFVPDVVDGTKGPLELFDKATKLAGDVVAFANEQLFAKYCEKFVGTFTATMTAHFFSKPTAQGVFVEWWTYSTTIQGTLTLRYPKGTEGRAVALGGQYEGGATRFTYKEDVFNDAIYGKIARGGRVELMDVPPAAVDNATGGMVNDVVSPTSFLVPVTGQMADGKVTLVLGDATSDFDDSYTKAHTVYVVFAPTTLMLPIVGHFSLPYTNAHFILDHIGKGDFPVTQSGESMTLTRTQDKTLPGPGNRAEYTIDLKACNPEFGGEP